MTLGADSHCVRHKNVKAVGRCRQCGSPFCRDCRVQADGHDYCGMECRAKHKRYAGRADAIDRGLRGTAFNRLIKRGLAVALLAAAVAAGLHFAGFDVPVLSRLLRGG